MLELTDVYNILDIIAKRYAQDALKEAVEIVKAHAEYERIDIDGSEANILNLIKELN